MKRKYTERRDLSTGGGHWHRPRGGGVGKQVLPKYGMEGTRVALTCTRDIVFKFSDMNCVSTNIEFEFACTRKGVSSTVCFVMSHMA